MNNPKVAGNVAIRNVTGSQCRGWKGARLRDQWSPRRAHTYKEHPPNYRASASCDNGPTRRQGYVGPARNKVPRACGDPRATRLATRVPSVSWVQSRGTHANDASSLSHLGHTGKQGTHNCQRKCDDFSWIYRDEVVDLEHYSKPRRLRDAKTISSALGTHQQTPH